MPTREEIVTQMRQALAVTEPELDTSIGTPVRKVIDVVGDVVDQAYADRYMLSYQYDIDSKSGSDLDDFVTLFGFTRIPARRSTGNVTFERLVASDTSVFIPSGTQVTTTTSPSAVFSTVVPSVLGPGEVSVSVPIQAVVGGEGGNVSVGAITRRISELPGINGLANQAATSGGTSPESDEQLRDRFRKSVFRNLAGTEQMYYGVAVDDEAVSQVNIVGVSKTHREQIEIVSGSAESLVQDAFYVYPGSSFFGPDIAGGDLRVPGAHYQFDTSSPSIPEVNSLDPVEVPDGIYDLEFEYVSTASRNDPADGVVNKVDIYLNGERATSAVDVSAFRVLDVFTVSDTSPLYRQNFRRFDESVPLENNFFVRLNFSPILPSDGNTEVVIDGSTYEEGTDFWFVNDITADGLAFNSLAGIEIDATVGAGLADGDAVPVQYEFNAVPRDVQTAIERWRLLTTDVLVHQARKLRLNLYFVVMLDPGATTASVKPEMFSALQSHVASVGFNGNAQVSDLLAVAHGVSGVDAVRFATDDDDGTNYAIQRVASDGSTVLETYDNSGTPARAIDVFTGDSEIIVLNDITLTARAANTFGTV